MNTDFETKLQRLTTTEAQHLKSMQGKNNTDEMRLNKSLNMGQFCYTSRLSIKNKNNHFTA